MSEKTTAEPKVDSMAGSVWLVMGEPRNIYRNTKAVCFCETPLEARRKAKELNEKSKYTFYFTQKVKPNRGISGK